MVLNDEKVSGYQYLARVATVHMYWTRLVYKQLRNQNNGGDILYTILNNTHLFLKFALS